MKVIALDYCGSKRTEKGTVIYGTLKRKNGTATVRGLGESHNGTYYTKFPKYLNLDITNQLD